MLMMELRHATYLGLRSIETGARRVDQRIVAREGALLGGPCRSFSP